MDRFIRQEKAEDTAKNVEGLVPNFEFKDEIKADATENVHGDDGQENLDDQTEKQNIEHGLIHNWFIDGQDIQVNVKDSKVILNGNVQSQYQKDEAERIAWQAPGVVSVENDLVINYDD